ncbi:hypothetical protein P7K49_011098 [Saguinus oedipus]|uniref:Uncharacterized protein n=1 Tax=Saguinus oedipus TaxID=9490 RepID=A0ABQ9VT54_SAGOE|nr:hypothetical protein P7K49_011098 [Saguinus oedipus]
MDKIILPRYLSPSPNPLALMDHGVKVASVLAYSFSRRCSYIAESDAAVKEKAIQELCLTEKPRDRVQPVPSNSECLATKHCPNKVSKNL